uniref:Uncharacterized protein n=1 Tax=Plectus sambesii TaxID=2011161 RepID=A0A914VT93_9BILA
MRLLAAAPIVDGDECYWRRRWSDNTRRRRRDHRRFPQEQRRQLTLQPLSSTTSTTPQKSIQSLLVFAPRPAVYNRWLHAPRQLPPVAPTLNDHVQDTRLSDAVLQRRAPLDERPLIYRVHNNPAVCHNF